MQKRKPLFRYLDRYIGIPVFILMSIFMKRSKRFPAENIKKIGVLKLAAIGDSILLIPTLRTLRQKYPDAEIIFICSNVNYMIIEKIRYVDRIFLCNVHSFLNPMNFFKFIRQLRSVQFDVLIEASQWERICAIIAAFAKSHFTVGFRTEKQFKHFLYDAVMPHTRTNHELEDFLSLLSVLGIDTKKINKDLEYFLTEKNRKFADEFLKKNNLEGKTVVCFHPGCGENGKPREWTNENYINLGKRLIGYDSSLRIIVSGSAGDVKKCNEIADGIGENVINVAGKYDLDDVVAILEKVKLIVCSNTGMLHIASCVGTKTLALHGPTDPVKWGAYNKNAVLIQSYKYCSPCLYLGHDYGCSNPVCMDLISVDDVFIHIRKAVNPELFPVLTV